MEIQINQSINVDSFLKFRDINDIEGWNCFSLFFKIISKRFAFKCTLKSLSNDSAYVHANTCIFITRITRGPVIKVHF